jgi:DNA-binding MarR family transcriptional regulator
MSEQEIFLNSLIDWIEKSTHLSNHALFRHVHESELSRSQIGTLFRLYHHGPNTVNDLADHLDVTNAAVSQLLNQMIDMELIERSTDPKDRRVKLIALTEKGRQVTEETKRSRHIWVKDFANYLTDEEQQKLLPTLELLNDRLKTIMAENEPECIKARRKAENS